MNAPLPTSAGVRVLDAALVQEALAASPPGARLRWLAEQVGTSEHKLLPQAAAYFGLRGTDMVALRRLRPDFELVSFADCQRRNCVVGKFPEDEGLTVVLADPTDARLRQWLEVRLRRRVVETALTPAADLQAFLVTAEKSVRAMDGVRLRDSRKPAAADESDTAVSISI